MSLSIHHLIIHELQTQQGSGDVKSFASQEMVDPDERAQLLIERLHTTFIRKEDVLTGFFGSGGDVSFPGQYAAWAATQYEEAAFLTFSTQTLELLRVGLQGVTAAKGGYLVYADFEESGHRQLGIYLVRDTDGLIFKKEGQSYTLDTITYLNTDKLAMAVQVSAPHYQRENIRYLQVIKHAKSQKEISEYFLNWIGIERPESSTEFTEVFLQALDQIPLPEDIQTGRPMEQDQFHKKVYAFATNSPAKSLDVREFDHFFYGDGASPLQDYIQQNDIMLDTEFRFDKSAMKKLYKYNVSAEGISLGFSKGDYRSGKVRTESDALVVIESPELARKILDLFHNG